MEKTFETGACLAEQPPHNSSSSFVDAFFFFLFDSFSFSKLLPEYHVHINCTAVDLLPVVADDGMSLASSTTTRRLGWSKEESNREHQWKEKEKWTTFLLYTCDVSIAFHFRVVCRIDDAETTRERGRWQSNRCRTIVHSVSQNPS